jgi:hypothetical protein
MRSQEEKDRIAKAQYQTILEEKAMKAFDDAMDPIRNMAAVLMAVEKAAFTFRRAS